MRCAYWWIIILEFCVLVFSMTGMIGIWWCQEWWSRNLLDLQAVLDSNTAGSPYPAVPGWGTFPGWVMASTFFSFGLVISIFAIMNMALILSKGGDTRGATDCILLVSRMLILIIAIVTIVFGNMFRSSYYYNYWYYTGSWNWMKDDLNAVLTEVMKDQCGANTKCPSSSYVAQAPFYCSGKSWSTCATRAYDILTNRWYDFGNWAIGFGIGVSILIMLISFVVCLYAGEKNQWDWWNSPTTSRPAQSQGVVIEGGQVQVQPDGTHVYVVQQGQPVVVQGAPQQGMVITQGQPVQGQPVQGTMVQGQPVYQQPVYAQPTYESPVIGRD